MTTPEFYPDNYIKYYYEMIQGSDEWLAARCGLLTASEMKLIISPTMMDQKNDKMRSHVYEMAAQRISKFVEPRYISDDMLRGQEDEFDARSAYNDKYANVTECGFVTNEKWGFKIGYSPDGLVGDDGLIEIKSRRQKFQVKTIVENVWDDKCRSIPTEYVLQAQTGLLVTERKWIDFISYSGGLPMATIRIFPDIFMQNAIIEAAVGFEAKVNEVLESYNSSIISKARLIPTERKEYEDMIA